MNKVLKHFKNNAPIYLILIACIVIVLIALFHKPSEEPLAKIDTKTFTKVTLEEAIKLFDDDKAKYLLITYSDCQATAAYIPTLQYVQVELGFDVYYLELDGLDDPKYKDQIDELGKRFDTDMTYEGKTKPLIQYLGYTPMTIIIKNQKVQYAILSGMSVATLETLAKTYGLGEA